MKLPQLVDYQQAMQAPKHALIDPTLKRSLPRRNQLGLPSLASGGFALTFDVEVDGQRYAIRCFHKQGNHLQERYAAIADFIDSTRLDFLVDVDYLEQGVRVGGGIFPIIRMQWVEGDRLDDWIEDNVHDPTALQEVRRNIADAVAALRLNRAAHGDLQHGNILVLPDRHIKLVDYDGMYVPALRPYGSTEEGNRNYQHPDRGSQYDESLDLFAAAVIDISLSALATEPELWKEFNHNSGERLLFAADDFAQPSRSSLFDRLSHMSALADSTRRLRLACEADIAAVAAALDNALPVTASSRRTTAAAGQPQTSLVIAATERPELLAHQGDEATVVGRIKLVKHNTERRGKTITFINFGDFRTGAFTVVAWDRAGRDLGRTFSDLTVLNGAWVSVTGLLTIYQRPHSRIRTPQIELRSARALRVISAQEARALLNGPSVTRTPSPPKFKSPRAPDVSAQRPASATRAPEPPATVPAPDAIQDGLNRLYSSPPFAARVVSAGSATEPAPSAGTPSLQAGSPWSHGGAPRVTTPTTPAHVVSRSTASSRQSPPPWTPPHRQQHQRMSPAPPYTVSGLGIKALLAAILLGPLGVVLGAAVVSQRKHYSRRDVQYAEAAIAVGVIWIVLLMALAVIVSEGALRI